MRRVSLRHGARVLVVLWGLAGVGPAVAQQVRPAQPGRADSLLAQGRLAAAEDLYYAASNARPRDPAARGALAAYLASRGRFSIALVLFDEARRFGADASRIAMARAAILPYTVAAASGEVTVPLTAAREPRTLGQVPVRATRADAATRLAHIDPNVTGVVLGREAARAFAVEPGRPLRELWIGELRIVRRAVRVDSLAGPDDLRIGLDVLWPLQPLFDETAGTLTLGRSVVGAGSQRQIPWILTFPGLLLVPEVGRPPVAIDSPQGRALLRGTRWQIDTRAATVRVDGPAPR